MKVKCDQIPEMPVVETVERPWKAATGRCFPKLGTALAGLLLFAAGVAAAEHPVALWPSPDWPSAEPAELGLNVDQLQQAQEYARSAGGSGMIVRSGHVVLRWGDQKYRYDIKSATKSFGAAALGIAIGDGKVELDAPARQYHPAFGVPPESNAETRWLNDITILHLATHTAGFDKPGGYEKLLFKPGTHWHYSDGGPNWLAECITLQCGQDVEELMFQRLFTPLGITRDDLRWRQNQYRPHQVDGIARREFGAGIHANVDALARFGYLHLRNGRWKDEQILPEDFVKTAVQPIASVKGLREWKPGDHKNAPAHYGLLWWNNADAELKGVPTDAYWAWGLYDSLVVVIPSLDLVIVRGGAAGRSWPRDHRWGHYAVLRPFLEPIVAAAGEQPSTSRRQSSHEELKFASVTAAEAPYPASRVIEGVRWAAEDQIIRLAHGSDNWPLTWADDGHLYTAYGDGWGFKPRVEKKLSLGIARVEGSPPSVKGINIRSEIEEPGDGRRGRKACGMLMTEGRLYLFLRNADRQGRQSQLAWSDDRGKTWTEADWRFESLGYPTFINFGQNYAGARDTYVYLVTHDDADAYQPADRFILMRVPKGRIRERDAYEFFVRRDANEQPLWTKDIQQRGAVFEHAGNCYRSGISYNAGLQRYLWCQVLPSEAPAPDGRGGDARFQGGFGIYDAPEPWGPWTTVFFTRNWDVGPGETGSIPPKWISADGKSLWMVFSGEDSFSLRQAKLIAAADPG